MKRHTEEFKRQIVARLTGSDAPSATSVAKEIGVSQASVLSWAKRYAGSYKYREMRKRRPEAWSKQERLETVLKTSGYTSIQLDEFLSSNGLSINDLSVWKNEVLEDFKRSSMEIKKEEPKVLPIIQEKIDNSYDLQRQNNVLKQEIDHLNKINKLLERQLDALEKELDGTNQLLALKLKRIPDSHPQ